MKPIKAWAVLENGKLTNTDDLRMTRAEATQYSLYVMRSWGTPTSVVRVEIREVPTKAKR